MIEDWFNDDLQNRKLGIENRQPLRQMFPEFDEGLLPGGIQFSCAIFVVQIDHDEQAGSVETLDGSFKLLAPFLNYAAGGAIHDPSWGGHKKRPAVLSYNGTAKPQ